jgi:hypothetical protein
MAVGGQPASRQDPLRVRVLYVDGATLEAPISHWSLLPGEGVDRVTVITPAGNREAQSASLYWLYPENDHWVVGEGSVRYDPNPLREVVISPDGTMTERRIDYLPDMLLRRDVKLGHWRPGEARP